MGKHSMARRLHYTTFNSPVICSEKISGHMTAEIKGETERVQKGRLHWLSYDNKSFNEKKHR